MVESKVDSIISEIKRLSATELVDLVRKLKDILPPQEGAIGGAKPKPPPSPLSSSQKEVFLYHNHRR